MASGPEDRSYFHNWISVIGGILSIILFSMLLFLFILDYKVKGHNPYVTGFTYLILPVFLVPALLLIPLGAWRERRRRLKGGFVRQFPHIDFNNPNHQKLAFTSIGVFTLFLLFSMYGTYRSYEFTESTTFCGKLCHKVMEPEYTAYQNSPHARVSCVQCHIGPGAEWYVRSKLSGMYQIYSVMANRFSRPIQTPIKNLRPAQETCEHCHWPQQFFGAIEQGRQYFLPDEANTEWHIRMLMFVGGGMPPYGKGAGIHWHMNIKNKVYYVAADEKRQVIPWVKKVGPDGKTTVYTAQDSKYTADKPPQGELRAMDCMDCHNRPSHLFKFPLKSVNDAIAAGIIDRSLPFVKRESVKALIADYKSHEQAATGIREHLEKFYRGKYPEVFEKKKAAVDRTVEEVVSIYRNNFFPKMNLSWKAYPNNIGHFIFPGCFRCHDGKHKSSEGQAIRNDCRACHNIIAQGNPQMMQTAVEGLEFKHPEDIGDAWKESSCYDCHTGELA